MRRKVWLKQEQSIDKYWRPPPDLQVMKAQLKIEIKEQDKNNNNFLLAIYSKLLVTEAHLNPKLLFYF